MLLYIKNLPPEATKNHIRALFAGLGMELNEIELTIENSAFLWFKDTSELLTVYRQEAIYLLGQRVPVLLISKDDRDFEIKRMNAEAKKGDLPAPYANQHMRSEPGGVPSTKAMSAYTRDVDHRNPGTEAKTRNDQDLRTYSHRNKQTEGQHDAHANLRRAPDLKPNYESYSTSQSQGGADHDYRLSDKRKKASPFRSRSWSRSRSRSRSPSKRQDRQGRGRDLRSRSKSPEGYRREERRPERSRSHQSPDRGRRASPPRYNIDRGQIMRQGSDGYDQRERGAMNIDSYDTRGKPADAYSMTGQHHLPRDEGYPPKDERYKVPAPRDERFNAPESRGDRYNPPAPRDDRNNIPSSRDDYYYPPRSDRHNSPSRYNSLSGRDAPHIPTRSGEDEYPAGKNKGHFLQVKDINPRMRIQDIHDMFRNSGIKEDSTKLICSHDDALYAYIEVPTPQDVFFACQMDGKSVMGTKITIAPIVEGVLEQNLDTLKLVTKTRDSPISIVTKQSSSYPPARPEPSNRTDERGGPRHVDDRYDSPRYEEFNRQREEPRQREVVDEFRHPLADKSVDRIFDAVLPNRPSADPFAHPEPRRSAPMEPTFADPHGPVVPAPGPPPPPGIGKVTFHGMPAPQIVDNFCQNVMNWVQHNMSHIEMIKPPFMEKYLEEEKQHALVTLTVRTPVYPSFPSFIIIRQVAIVIEGPEQEEACPACRDFHDAQLGEYACPAKDVNNLNKVHYLDNPEAPLHPFAPFSCTYRDYPFSSVMEAITERMHRIFKVQTLEGLHPLAVRSLEAKSYQLVVELYKSQIKRNPEVRQALIATKKKKIVFLSKDRILGSGTLEGVNLQTIMLLSLPGFNYVGKALQDVRKDIEEEKTPEVKEPDKDSKMKEETKEPDQDESDNGPAYSTNIIPKKNQEMMKPLLATPIPRMRPPFPPGPWGMRPAHMRPRFPPGMGPPRPFGMRPPGPRPFGPQFRMRPPIPDDDVQKRVIFDGILPEENVGWFIDNVMTWVKEKMPEARVMSGPIPERRVESDGSVHYLIIIGVSHPIYPRFPRFANIHGIACMITHATQDMGCKLCRSFHESNGAQCKARILDGQERTTIYIPSDPHHILSPVHVFPCHFYGQTYPDVMTALITLMRKEFGCPPAQIPPHKLLDWEARGFDIIYQLFKSQFDLSKEKQEALLGTRNKTIIFVNSDLILGSGTFEFIKTEMINLEYLPGDNYVGKVLEKIRHEVTTSGAPKNSARREPNY